LATFQICFAAFLKELALITIREMWGLESRSQTSRSHRGFYGKVSSRSLSQVSVSEVTVPTTSLQDRVQHTAILHL